MDKMKPIEHNPKPAKSMSQLAAEHPEKAGLQRLALAESLGVLPGYLEGRPEAYQKMASALKRSGT